MTGGGEGEGGAPIGRESPSDLTDRGRDRRVSPDLINKFLDNQTEELRLKATELELERQKDNNGFQFAQKSLVAQAEDRRHEREVDAKNRGRQLWLVFGVAALIVITVIVALVLDKEEVAKEIVKAVVFVAVGFLGGFGAARAKREKGAPRPKDSDAD